MRISSKLFTSDKTERWYYEKKGTEETLMQTLLFCQSQGESTKYLMAL